MRNSRVNFNNLTIHKYPDPVLRQVARPVEEITSEIVEVVERMTDLMLESSGIGLAAPQVGMPLRIILMSATGKRENLEVFVNPQLSGFEGISEIEEGCLSLPGLRVKVRRPASCTVSALDLEGNNFVLDVVELPAIILQHENDHLDGMLFIDRLNTVSRLVCRRTLKQMEREYKEMA